MSKCVLNHRFAAVLIAAAACFIGSRPCCAQIVIPGVGERVVRVADDFEDPKWSYTFNNPKSSQEDDEQSRLPGGFSSNGFWSEGMLRGHPDVVKRVPTPPGGLAGSEGSLLMVSQHTGPPHTFSGKPKQDDLIANIRSKTGGSVSVAAEPSVTVRVYLPPWEKWEQRTGNSFGFRATCVTHKTETVSGGSGSGKVLFGASSKRKVTKPETYWPGMFIYYKPGDGQKTQPTAQFLIRGGTNGGDFRGPAIAETGWWTLGMSFSTDGQVHYFARQGVDDLTAANRISSQYPYGYHCERVDSFFFDVVSGDNGNWSTPWIVDDPAFFYTRR